MTKEETQRKNIIRNRNHSFWALIIQLDGGGGYQPDEVLCRGR